MLEQSSAISTILSLKFSLRTFLARYPRLFYPLYLYGLLYRIRPIYHRFVSRDTQIVIEGFQRSANTFSVRAFQLAQPQPIKIAYHVHAPAQIIRAARWNIPTLVLIRNPKDAVASFAVKWPEVSIAKALRFYITFYKNIQDYKASFVIGEFEEVTQNFSKTIQRLNERFGTQFALFSNSESDKQKVLKSIVREKSSFCETDYFSNEFNFARKKEIIYEILDKKHELLLKEAEAIYYDFIKTKQM